MTAGEQYIEQHAKRIHVGGCGDRAAGDLFGGGELRRQATGVAREKRRIARLGFGLEPLGNAEVEQLHLTGGRDQHIRRLEVAMHDEVGVRMSHGGEHIEKEAESRVHTELLFIAVLIDVATFDVLEHEVGLADGRDARINETRDVRMIESREYRALATKAILACAADKRRVEQFDGGATFEASVTALGEPDAAHATLADGRHERVGANRRTGP
jgi:hypothetical protein